jgi:hypothetical protein
MGSAGTSNDERTDGGLGTVLRVRVELWLVVVMMALAFGAGILVTVLYEEPQDQAVVGTQLPSGQFTLAPPLTDDQISAGLPSGHPDVSGETGSPGGGKGDADAGDAGESAKDADASGGSK